MILSVLISTYNYDCSRLLRQLHGQLPAEGEIILGDDCSTDPDVVRKNREASDLPRVRILRPVRNLGRAGIRNALAREAKGEWLLFIDADAEVRSASFIADYLAATSPYPTGGEQPLVVCGGTGNLPDQSFVYVTHQVPGVRFRVGKHNLCLWVVEQQADKLSACVACCT